MPDSVASQAGLADKAVWAAVMAGPKMGEDASDPHVVRRMLDAARLACAGVFPRCPTSCDDDCEQPCHEVHSLPPRREHDPGVCVGVIVAAAVAAERKRCIALAEQRKAICLAPGDNYFGGLPPGMEPFAVLLRQEPGPGEAGHPGPQGSEGAGAP